MAGRQDYEERKERRKEIYQERAIKLKEESNKRANSNAHRILSIAPEQPILIGHHSERTARKLHRQAEYDTRKSIELADKSTYYADRAENIDNNNVISSDDPKAIENLQDKLKKLEEQKVKIKAREHDWYELPYINADIKRTKDRIKDIQELDELTFEDIIFNGGKALKVGIQALALKDIVGHRDIQTTLNIYAEVQPNFKESEFEKLGKYLTAKNLQ